MKIKSKIGGHMQKVTPVQWRQMEKTGISTEYEVVERNTIWAEALDLDKRSNGNKREFEIEHWENMLKQCAKLSWKRTEPRIDNAKFLEDYDTISETSELQAQNSDLRISLQAEQLKLVKLQQSELKGKWKYFALGVLIGLAQILVKLLSGE